MSPWKLGHCLLHVEGTPPCNKHAGKWPHFLVGMMWMRGTHNIGLFGHGSNRHWQRQVEWLIEGRWVVAMSGRPGCALGSSDMGKWVCMVIVMLMYQYLPLVIYAMWISHEKPNFLGFAYTPEYMGIQLSLLFHI